jgi:hypothetical protein
MFGPINIVPPKLELRRSSEADPCDAVAESRSIGVPADSGAKADSAR